jgi:hypothetical protein
MYNPPILATERHVLHTDAVITDCILGNGEALDCYNQKLQDADAIKSGLENLKLIQNIALIEAMPTAQEKLDALARLNGSCCGNINDTIRSIAQQIIPLIASSGGGSTTPPEINNPPV